jgi:uncharacterized protein (TIGR02996 family)
MPTEPELWRRLGEKIVSSPDDDDPRYQFARFLEPDERNEEIDPQARARARFIRMQLRLASMDADHPEWFRMATQAAQLAHHFERFWVPEAYQRLSRPRFHRGFVELITISATDLAENARWLFVEAPIRHLDIVDVPSPGYVEKLFDRLFSKTDSIRQVVSLSLDGQGLADDEVRVLARLPWERLRWLSLANNQIGEDGVIALVEELRTLQYVDLHGNPFDPTDELTFDQDVVVRQQGTSFGEQHSEIAWLRSQVVSGQVVYPNRLDMSRSETIERSDTAFA